MDELEPVVRRPRFLRRKSGAMVMKLVCCTADFFLLAGGCGYKGAYFGVKNRAIIVPKEFGQTEAAIGRAEKSPGAK